MSIWRAEEINFYYDGLRLGEYPKKIWQEIAPWLPRDIQTMLDIASGAGAMAYSGLQRGYRVTALDIDADGLGFLAHEAAAQGWQERLRLHTEDFRSAAIARHDLVSAAYCFHPELSGRAVIAKMLSLASRAALFVFPADEVQQDFLAEQLPGQEKRRAVVFKPSPAQAHLVDLAAEQGLPLHRATIYCDFGCPYRADDPVLLQFVARKTGYHDLPALARHLAAIAVDNQGQPWLPNPKRLTYALVETAPAP